MTELISQKLYPPKQKKIRTEKYIKIVRLKRRAKKNKHIFFSRKPGNNSIIVSRETKITFEILAQKIA